MKIKAVSILTSLLLVLSMALTGATAFADHKAVPNGLLTSQIDYWFVGHLGIVDDEGRLQAYDGTIQGDIEGSIKYWLVLSPSIPATTFVGGEVLFYTARWEIFDSAEELILAGDSAGKTVFADGEDGVWDGHGVVTEANGKFNPLKGRKIYESGPVDNSDPPLSYSGTAMFLIY